MQTFHQLFDETSSTYTYLLIDAATRQALLIDPVDHQLERDMALLRACGATLAWVVETHAHADHITSAGHVALQTGARTAAPSGCDIQPAQKQLIDADTLQFGTQTLRAIHTPGHTAGSMSYLWEEATPAGPVANAFLRDIRARREAEQRLARSEQRLRDVLCTLPAVVCHFDARQRCLFANDYALQSRGLIARPQVGLYAHELLGDVQYALHLPYLMEALAGRRAQFEGCIDHEGTPRHLQSHLIPEFDGGTSEGGSEGSAPPAVVGFYLMSFDVTALKELQLRQERTERRLRAIADNLPVMITYIDRAHRLQFLNHTFEEWTGIPIEHALGKPLPDVIGPALYAQRVEPLRRALTGQRVQFEVESEAMGMRRILQTDYIPDMLAVGEVLGIYTLTTDVTAIRQSERRMQELAMTDTLTGLANRRQFDIHLAAALQASRVAGTGMALMFLDIDHFKAINDTWGHAAGDAALVAMAERLQDAVRSTDFPARIAGDEFAVVLPHLSSCDEAQTVAHKVLHAIREPLPQLQHNMPRQMSASIGVAYLAPGDHPVRPTDLLLAADRALYSAKHKGRDACAVHQVDLRELG